MKQSLPSFDHVPFYAYLIRLNNLSVGSIQKISVSSDRQEVQTIREIGNSRGAEIKEFTWGGVNTTIDIERIELYSSSLMQALGYPLFYNLEDFNFTFDIQELVLKSTGDPYLKNITSIKRPNEDYARNSGDGPNGRRFLNNGAALDQAVVTRGTQLIEPDNQLVRNITYKDCIPTRWTKTVDRGTLHVIETMQVRCRTIKVISYAGSWNPEG